MALSAQEAAWAKTVAWELVNTEGLVEGRLRGPVLCRARLGTGAGIGPMVEPMLQRATQLQVSHSYFWWEAGCAVREGTDTLFAVSWHFRIDALFTARRSQCSRFS